MQHVRLLLVSFSFFYNVCAIGQCVSVSTSSPYVEDFDLSNGGWASGGTNNDWVWGAPTKSVINSAGSGTKCWISGGVNGGSYQGGERSFVKSPCFDFSGLQHPRIRFKLFWESEKTYDGGSLQASTNGGSSWIVIGTHLDTADCETQNWYNSNYINNLNGLSYPPMGWSGNIQPTSGICLGGNGSGAWLTAKHCLNGLGGQSNVLLRFTFGSGTSCNDFDGIAFDAIVIDESPEVAPDFNFQCNGGKTFQFTNKSSCNGDLLWTFNDPASGAIQQAVIDNPVYSFVGNSPYSVQLQVTNTCGVTSSVTKSVVGISYTETQTDVSCTGKKDGNITLQMNGGTAPFSYQWNTTPISITSSISNLDTGRYIVRINDSKNCEASDTFHLNYLPAIEDTFTIRVETCGEGNGSIAVQTDGGSSPYSYTWSNSATGNLISNLSASTYLLTTTDSRGCTATSSVLLNGTPSVPAKIVELNANKCFGDSIGMLQALPLAGSAPFSYQWSASPLTVDTLKKLPAGIYQVTVTDKNNCSGAVSYTLSSPTALQLAFQTTPAFCEQAVGIVQSITTGGTIPYSYAWSNGETNSIISGLNAGFYYLTITDANQCSSIDSVNVFSSPPLAYTFEITDDTCSRKTGQIIVHASSGIAPFYFDWKSGFLMDSILTNVTVGNYSVLIKDSVGCMDTLDFAIPAIVKNYGMQMDTAFCFERNSFQISPGKFFDYLWENGSRQEKITITAAGIYVVKIKDDWGCVFPDTIVVDDLCRPWVSFPTAFSPNGDGVNDVFRPAYKNEFNAYRLQVYNRWGELVFASSSPKSGWDGVYKDAVQPMGVYIYKLEYAFYDASVKLISGNVTLVR
jgi:gliding motility-associated-like protein